MAKEVRERYPLTVALLGTAMWIDADAGRMAQVVVNLLNNAAKYTEDGRGIWLTLEKAGTDALVPVHDEGIGILTYRGGRVRR